MQMAQLARQLLIAITEDTAKLEAEEDLRSEDQHARFLQSCFYLLRKIHLGGFKAFASTLAQYAIHSGRVKE
jgi:hypothetical protein